MLAVATKEIMIPLYLKILDERKYIEKMKILFILYKHVLHPEIEGKFRKTQIK